MCDMRRSYRPLLPQDTVQCPYCGAWNMIAEGQTSMDCGRCGKTFQRGGRE